MVYIPLSPINVYEPLYNFFSLDIVKFSSIAYDDELCFVIVGIRDVEGLEQANEVSKHLRIFSLQMWDMLIDWPYVWYEHVYFL